MYLVILKCMPCDLLNHVHDVGSKTTALEGPLADTPDLAPYEIKDAKRSCIRCNPMEQAPGVICNVSLVSTLAINGLPEHPIQVSVSRVKT